MSTVMDFFAAANGYDGFRSYFNQVFNSEVFDKVYVIKGGPGTGKSSFMKKIVERYSDREYLTECIHCSSDPNSLDGVIITSGDKKIALLDGTAPHERDAVVVGAIDEIINLAEGLDMRFLHAERKEILALSKEKKRAYDIAYAYLKIAGETQKLKRRSSLKYDIKKFKNKIKNLAEIKKSVSTNNVKIRLISSFGCGGIKNLDTLFDISERVFSITGDYYRATSLMNEVRLFAEEEGTEIIICPAVFDGSCIEAIYFPATHLTFTVGGNGEKILTDNYFPTSDRTDNEISKKADELSREAFSEAQRWFAIASDFHFRLEEKYVHAMDFSHNEEIFNKKATEIDNILQSLV